MSKYLINANNQQFDLETLSSNIFHVNGKEIPFQLNVRNNVFQLRIGEKNYNLFYKKINITQYEIWLHDKIIKVNVENTKSQLLNKYQTYKSETQSTHTVKAPMPGLITNIEVSIGDEVSIGTGLIILEAMKMENEIRSTIAGKIQRIEIQERAIVEKDQILMTIEPTKK